MDFSDRTLERALALMTSTAQEEGIDKGIAVIALVTDSIPVIRTVSRFVASTVDVEAITLLADTADKLATITLTMEQSKSPITQNARLCRVADGYICVAFWGGDQRQNNKIILACLRFLGLAKDE